MSQSTEQPTSSISKIEACYSRYFDTNPITLHDILTNERLDLPIKQLIRVDGLSDDNLLNTPVVVSLPHSGQLMPMEYTAHFNPLGDHLIEIDLYGNMPFEKISATFLRSNLVPMFIDMNRSRAREDKQSQLPRHLQNSAYEYYTIKDKPILKKPYSKAEVDSVLKFYDLYHDLLEVLLNLTKQKFGYAILIDGHCMTSIGLGRVYDEAKKRKDIVVGDLNGHSASEGITSGFIHEINRTLVDSGLNLKIGRNKPYSGGFITRIHSRPSESIFALQVEVAMNSYMNELYSPEKPLAMKGYRLTALQRALQIASRKI